MERSVQLGDYAVISINGKDYTFPLTYISPTLIIAGDNSLIPIGNIWQVKNYITPHTVYFASPLLPQLPTGVPDIPPPTRIRISFPTRIQLNIPDSFVTEIIAITENGVINEENFNIMFNYLRQEVNANDIHRNYSPRKEHFQVLYDEIQSLLGVELSSDILDKIAYEGMYLQSINPTLEIIAWLESILQSPETTPENCAIIVIKYKNIIIGYISVIIDSKTTFNGEKVAYFIGIRKSASLMAAQYYFKYLAKNGQNHQNILDGFILSETIIPAVEAYARSLNAVYLITTPLSNMTKILTNYYEFQGTQRNTMVNLYNPPAYIITIPQERIVWKKLSY